MTFAALVINNKSTGEKLPFASHEAEIAMCYQKMLSANVEDDIVLYRLSVLKFDAARSVDYLLAQESKNL